MNPDQFAGWQRHGLSLKEWAAQTSVLHGAKATKQRRTETGFAASALVKTTPKPILMPVSSHTSRKSTALNGEIRERRL